MTDPTYMMSKINANRVWKLAFLLSEFDNDRAPIGWSNYIPMAEFLLRYYKMEPRDAPEVV